MSKLRNKLITVLAVLFCTLLVLSAAFLIPTSKTASAARQSGDTCWYTIDELYQGGDFPFKKDKLSSLYTALTGKNNYTALKSELASKGGKMTSADFRTQQGGTKNVSVWLGGIKWDVVYMTTVRTDDTYNTAQNIKGDVIITLWQSADDQHSSATAKWANSKDNSTSNDYPSNMYSTSLIRSETLNAGGYVSNSSHSIPSDPQSQRNSIDYAKFTMSGVSGSLVKYLVQPKDVKYQEDEASIKGRDTNGYNVNTDNNCPNDAYGEPKDSNWYNASGLNMNYKSTKAHYDDWKDDYLWLPSMVETGKGNNGGSVASANVVNGIWQTNQNLRSTYYTGTYQNEAWLRSGVYVNANYAIFLTGTGDGYSTYCDDTRAVRPALHFNLTKAAQAAGGVPYENALTEHDYDGDTVTVDIPEYSKLTIGGADYSTNYSGGKFSAIVPDKDGTEKTYSISAEPNEGYFWLDTNGNVARDYKIKINPAEMQVNWSKSYTVTSGESLLQSSSLITSKESKLTSSFTTSEVKYLVILPDGYNTSLVMPDDSDNRWGTEGNVPNSTPTDAGKYKVWYKITADYHVTETGYYDVTVGNDEVTVSIKSDGVIGSAIYATGDSLNLTNQTWLKDEFKKVVTMTSKSVGEFSDLTNVDIALFKYKSDGTTKEYFTANDYGFFDVGTYYLDIQGSGSTKFTFDGGKYPSFTVTQKTIIVEVVADGDHELTHVYGSELAKMKYKYNLTDLAEYKGEELEYAKVIAILGLGKFCTTDGVTLDRLTPVDTYYIEGEKGASNYSVTIDAVEYTITPRKIVWQVTDQSVKYGTDLTSYNFKNMTIFSGDRANGESIPELTANAKYYLKKNGFKLDDMNVEIGEYELCAELSYPNYDFSEVKSGTLTVTEADFDMTGVELKNAGYKYDGNPHKAELSGKLPSEEIQVTYRYVNMADGSSSEDAPVEIGLYLVYASFTHSNPNYNLIDDKVGYIRIAATLEEANGEFPKLPSDEEIEAAKKLAEKKAEAKKKLDDVAKAKKEEIAAMEIGDDEKAKANSEIDKELAAGNVAIDAVDAAAGESGVEQAFNEGKKKIEDISAACKAAEERAKQEAEAKAELERKKQAAKDELEKAANDKNAEIDANEELTDEERAEAKKKVETELEKGNAAIDGATDTSGVESAASTSKRNIENIKGVHREDSSFPWWIIAVAAGVLLLLIALVIVIVKRRQVADGDDEYDDFYDDEYDFDEENYEEEDFGDFE